MEKEESQAKSTKRENAVPQSGNPDGKTTWGGVARMPTRGLDTILSPMFDYALFYQQNIPKE